LQIRLQAGGAGTNVLLLSLSTLESFSKGRPHATKFCGDLPALHLAFQLADRVDAIAEQQ